MSFVIAILALLLLALVVLLVGAPLRGRHAAVPGAPAGADSSQRTDERTVRELERLQAERESKYREIRDAELDYRTGKLSRADFEAIDGQLRAEAILILDRLERADPDDGPAQHGPAQHGPA